MQRFFLVLIPAVWVVAIAIVAVQNATPVAIRFIAFQSVELPFGLVLSFCAAGGMLLTALLMLFLEGRKPSKQR
ncbi:lipopolysaccharide assembly protein LapA domain-containing protein [Oscillatoria sp. CS-180]|uniref:lipopolysaccharide assembly protein LapA domain-containing protein n=1 Tax=Oscillatoria sp. CS-180 TaxID=3021720 RepID=UPI002330FC9B|nr:lipopolysaccharide assembly protein LapA domain-containing protein [Oscillatoria sp. CS-180]MDB9529085.1 lipopolysaccharide assembly protein LapA domain-containing protein [Oscillatoria sp. CS-180]